MTNKTQQEQFVQKARELGCDEREAVFDGTPKRLAVANPKPTAKRAKKSWRGRMLCWA